MLSVEMLLAEVSSLNSPTSERIKHKLIMYLAFYSLYRIFILQENKYQSILQEDNYQNILQEDKYQNILQEDKYQNILQEDKNQNILQEDKNLFEHKLIHYLKLKVSSIWKGN